jgi:uncharacterized membrane protein YidH (DUF202 family)
MHTLTFVVASLFFLVAVLVTAYGLLHWTSHPLRARRNLTIGYTMWLLGILAAAIVFIVFSE